MTVMIISYPEHRLTNGHMVLDGFISSRYCGTCCDPMKWMWWSWTILDHHVYSWLTLIVIVSNSSHICIVNYDKYRNLYYFLTSYFITYNTKFHPLFMYEDGGGTSGLLLLVTYIYGTLNPLFLGWNRKTCCFKILRKKLVFSIEKPGLPIFYA